MTAAVSVIIPAYNAERFLRQAIESVLGQSVLTDVIVVDDGSDDSTSSVAQAYGNRIRLIRMPHRGPAATRNTGLESADCNLIAFLDADDIWTAGKLEMQVGVLAAQPHIDMVFGRSVEFAESSQFVARAEPAPNYCASSMLARRAVFDRIGTFSETVEIGEFMDWYSRATVGGATSVMLEDIVFRRRIHQDNMTSRIKSKRGDYLEVIRNHLERKRAQGNQPD